MLLSVQDRLVLLYLLPAEGNITTLRLLRELRESLGFDDAERAAIELTEDGGNVKWNTEKAGTKEVEIGDAMSKLIRKQLTDLDRQGKLRNQHIAMYERFVEHEG